MQRGRGQIWGWGVVQAVSDRATKKQNGGMKGKGKGERRRRTGYRGGVAFGARKKTVRATKRQEKGERRWRTGYKGFRVQSAKSRQGEKGKGKGGKRKRKTVYGEFRDRGDGKTPNGLDRRYVDVLRCFEISNFSGTSRTRIYSEPQKYSL